MSDMFNISNETYCQRVYRTFDPGVRNNTNDSVQQRIKGLSLSRCAGCGPHANFEHRPKSAEWVMMTVVDKFYSEPDISYFMPLQVPCSDGGWCLWEVCGDITGNSLTYRFYVRQLSTGQEWIQTSYAGTGASSTQVGHGVTGVLMFGQNQPSNYRQYISHAMQVRVPYDPTFWIGPAYELEGEQSPTPTPTATPEPTPTPTPMLTPTAAPTPWPRPPDAVCADFTGHFSDGPDGVVGFADFGRFLQLYGTRNDGVKEIK
jgi:hypothetical protein